MYKVLSEVAKIQGVKEEELLTRSRLTKGSESRKIFAFISCRVLGFSISEIALYLDVSIPSVSWSVKEAEKLVDGEIKKYFTNLTPG